MIYIKKILILFGSNSYEHEVSCDSVNFVIKNIDTKKYNYDIVGIDYNNNWYLLNKNIKITPKWLKEDKKIIDNTIKFAKKYDVVIPIIHGNTFEDGKLQSLFELNNINYVGCDSYSSIISYDKLLTKLILEKYNIKQVKYYIYQKDMNLNEIEYPIIIKPCKCGSSLGINVAKNKKEALKCINEALKYDNSIILEQYIENKEEYECAILQDKKKTIVSDIGIILNNGCIYDYKAKYKTKIETDIANINTKLKKEIQSTAKKIFHILGCKDLSRVDFLYDIDNKEIYFNEINTMPGFTEISMYPKLMNIKGVNAKKLISILIENN
ncbi:MAG: D-alanine--D-alanine ligase [Bacilli bacterium]|nr:D-alanine--D-alanine ligase [Bacilli bacterium]